MGEPETTRWSEIREHLTFLYAPETATTTQQRLQRLLAQYRRHLPVPQPRVVSERDSILITYADMVRAPTETPLATLADFLQDTIAGTVSTVHLLPFFPYSSDDGFSVIDYKQVDPQVGTWTDVARLGQSFRLMFDAVINHVSVAGPWFQAFLADEEPYRDFFTVVEPRTADLALVFRPRTLPLLTPFETAAGTRHVWTTFSEDQADLNYANPDVLIAVFDVLLFYVVRGAEFIRLDAIAFIWKELGTDCIHRPQTHRLVQLMRAVLNLVAPQVSLITETNVPHRENISYFGNGHNEAQMVYNFPLPPLTLHAFHTGDATILTAWARTLALPSDAVTFFNFLASHDGVGVTPARGYLSDAEVAEMARRVEALGGYVSYRSRGGARMPYELNISYLDALRNPEQHPEPDPQLDARRFLASQSIMLALRGVPGIYFHSLFGSRGWPAGAEATGRARTINRQKLQHDVLRQELADPDHLRHHVYGPYLHMLRQRAAEPAFHPNGGQEVLAMPDAVFGLLRTSLDRRHQVICLHNVGETPVDLHVPVGDFGRRASAVVDILTDEQFAVTGGELRLTLSGYGTRWLKLQQT